MAIDYVNYVLGNPDLRENVEALGLTNAEIAEWGDWHWNAHGENEGRLNTPDAQDFTPGFTQTLGPEHYQERDVEDVLQASVRAGYKGADVADTEMWEAREAIAPAWNLGQYTAEGWNLAPDVPYKTGILGDTIEVNRDIGQLVPTAAGDQRFLQDRYVDASIASDFPVGWTTPENTWAAAAPQQLGNYWDVLTNATRDEAGILGRVDPYDPTTAVGPSVSPGTRGGGNIRVGGTNISTTGPPNPTVPSFGYPGYQDWTRFMPTNFQLAEDPNWGDASGSYANDVAILSGGGTRGVPPVTYIPPGMETGTTAGGNVTTDTSGNQWVMTPGGQWVPAGSDQGKALASGNARDPNFYDSSGAFMGAEGQSVFATMQHKFNPVSGKFEMMSVPGSGAGRVPGKFLQGLFPYSAAIPTTMTQQEYNERLARMQGQVPEGGLFGAQTEQEIAAEIAAETPETGFGAG